MYELIEAGARSYYFQCPAKIGLVRLEDADVCLIDSGGDKSAARKVRQALEANGWRLRAIYLTHAHADHVGGSGWLQEQTGCAVYAPGLERSFAESPVLEPVSLCGGFPSEGLRHKFLMAQACEARPLTPETLPAGWEAIPLPGHSPDMTGYRTPDDVLYLGDCLASRETIEKYGLVFLYDVGAYLRTLEAVAEMRAQLFVPAHAPAAERVTELARFNIEHTLRAAEYILSLCEMPVSFEEILQAVFRAYGLTMDLTQYALVGSTVRSYLAWLADTGRLEIRFENERLLWARKT